MSARLRVSVSRTEAELQLDRAYSIVHIIKDQVLPYLASRRITTSSVTTAVIREESYEFYERRGNQRKIWFKNIVSTIYVPSIFIDVFELRKAYKERLCLRAFFPSKLCRVCR